MVGLFPDCLSILSIQKILPVEHCPSPSTGLLEYPLQSSIRWARTVKIVPRISSTMEEAFE